MPNSRTPSRSRQGGSGRRTCGSTPAPGPTWATIDERGSKKNAGVLKRQEGRKLTRQIKRLLGEDRVERARRTGEKATLLRAEGKEKEAWAVVKGWYRKVSE